MNAPRRDQWHATPGAPAAGELNAIMRRARNLQPRQLELRWCCGVPAGQPHVLACDELDDEAVCDCPPRACCAACVEQARQELDEDEQYRHDDDEMGG